LADCGLETLYCGVEVGPACEAQCIDGEGFSTVHDIVSDSERKCVLVGSLVG
jgi:hypothetical protein